MDRVWQPTGFSKRAAMEERNGLGVLGPNLEADALAALRTARGSTGDSPTSPPAPASAAGSGASPVQVGFAERGQGVGAGGLALDGRGGGLGDTAMHAADADLARRFFGGDLDRHTSRVPNALRLQMLAGAAAGAGFAAVPSAAAGFVPHLPATRTPSVSGGGLRAAAGGESMLGLRGLWAHSVGSDSTAQATAAAGAAKRKKKRRSKAKGRDAGLPAAAAAPALKAGPSATAPAQAQPVQAATTDAGSSSSPSAHANADAVASPAFSSPPFAVCAPALPPLAPYAASAAARTDADAASDARDSFASADGGSAERVATAAAAASAAARRAPKALARGGDGGSESDSERSADEEDPRATRAASRWQAPAPGAQTAPRGGAASAAARPRALGTMDLLVKLSGDGQSSASKSQSATQQRQQQLQAPPQPPQPLTPEAEDELDSSLLGGRRGGALAVGSSPSSRPLPGEGVAQLSPQLGPAAEQQSSRRRPREVSMRRRDEGGRQAVKERKQWEELLEYVNRQDRARLRMRSILFSSLVRQAPRAGGGGPATPAERSLLDEPPEQSNSNSSPENGPVAAAQDLRRLSLQNRVAQRRRCERGDGDPLTPPNTVDGADGVEGSTMCSLPYKALLELITLNNEQLIRLVCSHLRLSTDKTEQLLDELLDASVEAVSLG
jgi:hypothetical protein